jgi:hypothetical protein
MRAWLGLGLAAALLSLVGCSGSDVARVAGFPITKVKTIYAPKVYCDEVKEEKPDEGYEAEIYYRVVCLKNHQFGRNLLRACRDKPRTVRQQYWIYNPAEGHAGYITCDDMRELGFF